MIAAGVNAKSLSTFLGHSSIAITFDRYGHLMPGNEQQAASLLDQYLLRCGEPSGMNVGAFSGAQRRSSAWESQTSFVLENRYGSLGSSRVQIPPSPLNKPGSANTAAPGLSRFDPKTRLCLPAICLTPAAACGTRAL